MAKVLINQMSNLNLPHNPVQSEYLHISQTKPLIDFCMLVFSQILRHYLC
ncbi:hypothetical protein CRENPOLYSF2_3070001 [Crenothrix polyspora]|uniref:Uncharacterized protein n=1 Tax=Crenothrix polyspora TaxID=360316 RepID=A0A1R4HB26_9GAMM|nr:hypothetical protein CRENPOLYSF2_3070001 [Crenothrix polyspora]